MYAHDCISELNKPGLKRASYNDINHDPRLRNFASGERIILDQRPYIEYGCPDTNIYTPEYKVKPRVYNNYNDIDLGLILYNTDSTVVNPFIGPAINMQSVAQTSLFKTPSDVYWKQYKLTPKYCNYNYLNCTRSSTDILKIRENLLSEYSGQLNKHRFLAF